MEDSLQLSGQAMGENQASAVLEQLVVAGALAYTSPTFTSIILLLLLTSFVLKEEDQRRANVLQGLVVMAALIHNWPAATSAIDDFVIAFVAAIAGLMLLFCGFLMVIGVIGLLFALLAAIGVMKLEAPAIPGGFKAQEAVYYLGETQTFTNGDSVVHGGQCTVTGAGSGEYQGYVTVKFVQNWADMYCSIDQLSRQPAGPIPGGYKDQEVVYNLGQTESLDNGDTLVYGGRGTVTGAGYGECQGYVIVRFDQNKCSTNCEVQTLSRQPAGPIPGGFQVYQTVYFLGATQTLDNGDTVVYGGRGTVRGAGYGQGQGCVVVKLDHSKWCLNCLVSQISRQPIPGVSQALAPIPAASRAQQVFEMFHGTSMTNARSIQSAGFRPSGGGCLGPGIYLAARNKAARFGHDRHSTEPAMLRCQITVTNPKYVSGNDGSWQSQGYDSCHADRTSASTNPEWCVKSPHQIRVLEIIDLKGTPRPTA